MRECGSFFFKKTWNSREVDKEIIDFLIERNPG
jgi:hypothetical protein